MSAQMRAMTEKCVSKTVVVYPLQVYIAADIAESISKAKLHVMKVATGQGKTMIALMLANYLATKHNVEVIIVVASTYL